MREDLPLAVVKSVTMARKGILITDNRILRMTPVRWYYEYLGFERSDFLVLDRLQQLLVGILGLNILPPVPDEAGKLRPAQPGAFMPLTLFVGRKELLKDIVDKEALMNSQSDITDLSLEEAVALEKEAKIRVVESTDVEERELSKVPFLEDLKIEDNKKLKPATQALRSGAKLIMEFDRKDGRKNDKA